MTPERFERLKELFLTAMAQAPAERRASHDEAGDFLETPALPPTGLAAESLAISPDGQSLIVAYWDQNSNLMLADHVPGIGEHRAPSP